MMLMMLVEKMLKVHLKHQLKESDEVVGKRENEDDANEYPPFVGTQTLKYQIQFMNTNHHITSTEYDDYTKSTLLRNSNIKQSVTFVWILIRTNIRIYSCQENDMNEYPNIFV